MSGSILIRLWHSPSDNRKSKIKNRKLAGIVAVVVTFALGGAVAEAQQPKKVSRIGYLSAGDPTSDSAGAEGIRLALRERGYIEGQNIAIEYRHAERKPGRYPELAAELVGLKVDIIVVAAADTAVRAARDATKTIPIIMVGGGADPVEAGLVESIASPGGNVTGITSLVGELGGKRLELLKEAVPKLARVALLYDPANPRVDLFRKSADYVNKILKGTKPADLAVQQATKFEFVVNLKAAKQIGLTIPGRVLERADKVIR